MTVAAATLATRLHAGQVDKQGAPYIDHLTAVVTILRDQWPGAPEWVLEAAWLQDALEGAEATPESLLAAGVSPAAVRLVQASTHPAEVSCADWIASLAVSGDLWALWIRLAADAYNLARGRAIPEMVVTRHAPAQVVLEAGERALCETGPWALSDATVPSSAATRAKAEAACLRQARRRLLRRLARTNQG